MAVSEIYKSVFADLNSCEHLFLREMGEPRANSLRLLIEEGIPSPDATSMNFAGHIITDVHPVLSGDNARLFEVAWDLYISYSVRNESYVAPDDSEEFDLGNLVRIYSKSKFLEYVTQATFASDEYPGPKLHVEVVCECHIIDVISTALPKVKRLRPI